MRRYSVTVKTVLTKPAAGAVIVVDELGAATLTDIAAAIGSPLSTAQRAVGSLEQAGVLKREWNRGPYAFTSNAPTSALRELADWTLGSLVASTIAAATKAHTAVAHDVPPSIRNPRIRRAWRVALNRLVSEYRPERVILFGSQARGDASDDSDVDLLLVFERVDDHRKKRVAIRKSLSDMPFAKDVVVASSDEAARPIRGTAVAEAMRDGLVVYER